MKEFLLNPIVIPFELFLIGLLVIYVKYRIQCYIDERRFWKLLKEQADRHERKWINITERAVKTAIEELKKNGIKLGC